MLFKKKDAGENAKAKTELFASKAKKADALEKLDEARMAPGKGVKGGHEVGKALNVGHAQGRVSPTILKRPRITEKASMMSQYNIYTFDVATTATKNSIMGAIKDVYNITPVQVRVVTIPAKHFVSRKGVHGKTSMGKKAYVYLKKGDTIELV